MMARFSLFRRRFVPRSNRRVPWLLGLMSLGIVLLVCSRLMFLAAPFSAILFYGGLASVALSWLVLLLFLSDLESFRQLLCHIGGGGALSQERLLRAPKSYRDMLVMVNDLVCEHAARRRIGEERLSFIINELKEIVIVVNEMGLVSFANRHAYALLGADKVRVGTSIFAMIGRDSYDEVLDNLSAGSVYEGPLSLVTGESLAVRLLRIPGDGGVLIFFGEAPSSVKAVAAAPDADANTATDADASISLLSLPSSPSVMSADSSLADLSYAVLDTETTGLNVSSDKIISFAAVRMHGKELFSHLNLDILINPDMPIPELSRRIHGIDDSMVRGQGSFASYREEIESFLARQVIVGHNIAFDLALLHREARDLGYLWRPRYYLDTCLLSGSLHPDLRRLELEDMAAHYGIDILGRHTALGDVLVTATLWRALLSEMAAEGIRTLGDAILLQSRREDLLSVQRGAGWYDWQATELSE